MEERSVIHGTFVIERVYPASVQRVFSAFTDPAKKRRWFVDAGGNKIQTYELDFRLGGKELSRFIFKEGSPVTGLECAYDAVYLDIVPDRRIVFASTMVIGGKCISASLDTFEFLQIEMGTSLILTNQGAYFEGADGPEMREGGWRKLFDQLSELFPA